MDGYSRRRFVRNAAIGSAAGSAFFGAGISEGSTRKDRAGRETLPREVWVATICQAGLKTEGMPAMIRAMLKRMEETIPLQPDVICLPETFHVSNQGRQRLPITQTSESPIGDISGPFARFAKQHQCNIICPIMTVDTGRFYNSALVIDRNGNLVGEYRKINPTVGELESGVSAGPVEPPVFELDFGTIGVQICYDINWHENWKRLREKGAEIVFWPSAFAGGQMLNVQAWLHKVYVVSSTRIHASKIVDVLGVDMAATGRFDTWVCYPLNLDVAVVQTHAQIDKLDAVRAKYGRSLAITVQHVEAFARLESRSPDVRVSDVLREFELETSHDMLSRETKLQDASRSDS